MSRKENYNYFSAFLRMAGKADEAAKKLLNILSNFDYVQMETHMNEMHAIEHDADLIHHELLQKLAREFITPIEREDIMDMGHELDEVVDKIEDVVQRIYMYNLRSIPENAIRMAEVIEDCCSMLIVGLEQFEDFRRTAPRLQESIIGINKLEEDGDLLYLQGIRNLYMYEKDPIIVNAWESTYTRLEKCCDACEHVADVMESIIMKNS